MSTASVASFPRSAPLPTRLEGGPFAVETRGLVKRYRRDVALDHLDLQVPEGAVYVLVGPNGAGKSTTLRVLMDLARADAGTARVLGMDPRAEGPRLRERIGYVPERHEWGYDWMRVGELLDSHGAFYPSWDRGYAARLMEAFETRPERRLGTLSKGQRRRVHLTLALAHRPALLVLDEPTDGLDPVMLSETLALLAEHIADAPTTVLISTHQMHDIDRLADHVGFMDSGRMVLQVHRDTLHRELRRYRLELPEGWRGDGALAEAVVRREEAGREAVWSIWGEERDVAQHLAACGATVRESTPLTLADAAHTLLSRKAAR